MSEFFDLDRPDGDDKPPPYQKTGRLAPGWKIASGVVYNGRLVPIAPDLWNGVITPERRVELVGYPDESE